MSAAVDFDVHGVVGVRLLDAGPAEVAAVERQLGPIQGTLTRDPDITIRFVEQLSVGPGARYVGLDALFDDDSLYLLRGKHKTRVRVTIPFDTIGAHCEIRAERGLVAVPLLVAIVNATALARGVLPLHASAFEFRGVGVLTTGWSKGGKTETLLGFMERGARYIGDEWVHIAEGGRTMYGLREPVRVWHWHLRDLPHIRSRIPRGDRLRIGAMGAAASRLGSIAAGANARGAGLRRAAARLEPLVRQQSGLDRAPAALFGQAALAGTGRPDVVLWLGSHASEETRIEEISSSEVASRMLHSLETEREPLLADYRRFRFAFPNRSSPSIEQARDRQRDLLAQCLGDTPAWSVQHPYPVSIEALCDAIAELLDSLPTRSG